MARPTTTTSRPQARAASATERMRATFEAKVVTATRCGASLISSRELAARRRASLGLTPSRTTLVESQTSASTPSSPSARKAASDGQAAEIGRRVELPVAGVHDEAERRADGERVRFRDRVRDRHVLDVERAELRRGRPATISCSVDLRRARLRQAAGLEEARWRSASRRPGARRRGHSSTSAPIWSSCAWVMKMPSRFVALLLDEAQVRIDEVDAGQVLLAAEAHAAIDEDPFARRSGPEAVERGVHADLAQAAERNEDEFVLAMPSASTYLQGRAAVHEAASVGK